VDDADCAQSNRLSRRLAHEQALPDS
jgi:hypothetical protein